MTDLTIRIGNKRRTASEGPVTLSAPIACNCGHESAEVLVDRGTHLTAFCTECRRYIKHLPPSAVGKPKAINEQSERWASRPDPINGFGIVLTRLPYLRGSIETVVGVFGSLPEKRRVLAGVGQAALISFPQGVGA